MDAFSDPRYSMVVGVCGAQMGKTEILFNVLAHRFVDGPYVPALFIGATEKMVRTVSKDRFTKMVISTPALNRRLDRTGHKDNITEKWFAGVRLGFAWPSPTELASHPAGLVLIDEVDRMVKDVGNEGDPVSLAAARTKNYTNSKIGVFSTPTIEGASAVESHYRSGTMGRWEIPCPQCNGYFIPTFQLLTWPHDDQGHTVHAEVMEGARLACPHCGTLIENKWKERMNAEGRYMFHVEHDGKLQPVGNEAPTNNIASYWVSGICSPWVTFGELATRWVAANSSHDNTRRQTVINTEFGEWWSMDGDRPEVSDVDRLIDDYEPGTCPEGVQIITMGVDVQRDGLFYSLWGWGHNSESWKLENGFLGGDTAYDDVWLRLTRVWEREIGGLQVLAVFIDSGYRPGDANVTPDHMVYKYCRQHNGRCFPVKGKDQAEFPYRMTRIDITLSGRTIKQGLRLFHVNTHYFKEFIYGRIRWPEELAEAPGRMHFDRETDNDFCRQMVAEELVIKPSGRFVWLRKGPNHYLDTAVYAACAASHLGVGSLKPLNSEPPEERKQEISAKKQRFIDAPRKGFIPRR